MKRSSAISRGLCLALLVTSARAQSVAAGARAVVSSETLPVYASMSASGAVKATLSRGDAVTIGLVLFGDDITWCAVSKTGETRRLGYATCESLEPERSASAAAEPPAAAPPKAKTFTIREVPHPAVTIREVPPAIPSQPAEPLPPIASTPAPAPPAVVAPPAPPAPLAPEPAPPAAPEPAAVVAIEVDLVDTALENSGLRASLANYTRSTNLLAFLDKGRLDEIDVPLLDRSLAAQFRPDPFYRAIGEQIRHNQSPERAAVLLEWLQSPLTQKIAGCERIALQPDSREELVAYAANMAKAPPSESRILLVHRLFDSVKTSEMEVDATIALVKTVAQVISQALPEEKRYSPSELNRALSSVKPRYSAIMKNARLVHYLFAFQTVSDEDLEQYVTFLESENGKWFIAIIRQGFADATGAISRGLRAEIARNARAKLR